MAQNFFLKEPSPTKVLLVNEDGETLKVNVENLPMVVVGDTAFLSVQVRNGVTLQGCRPQPSYFNVHLDNVLLTHSDGTFVPIPLNSTLTNMTNSNINSMLESYKSAYSILAAGVAAATLHYSKMTSNGVTTSEVYNLKE